MQLTVAAWDDRVFPVELDANESIDTLKAILEAESGLPASQQQLVHHGKPLPTAAAGQTLSAAGVSDGDVLMLLPLQPAGQQQRGGNQQQQQEHNPMMEMAEDGSAKAPAAFIQAVKAQPRMMAALQQSNPALASAIRDEDISAMQIELRAIRKLQGQRQAELAREQALLEADPFDPDVQRRIEELIQKQNIEENLAAALEHNPEVFGSVEMLYVDMEVNGVPVKAFVDSGAQMTIMTHDFAEKCYLTRLLDKRFAGLAVGVGSSRILGRIHQAPLNVAGHFTTCSITVLEQRDGPQFIFGLDMLKRHLCVLDMAAGELRFGSCDATLKFLPEHLIPKDFKRHIEEVSKQQAEKNVEESKQHSASGTAAGAPGSSGAGPSAAARGDSAAGAATPAAAPPVVPGGPVAGGQQQGVQQQPAAHAGGAAAARAAGGAGSNAAVNEAAVGQLMQLGFPRDVALQALQAAGGNVDVAASMLFSM